MEVKPNTKKRFSTQTFNVIYDNRQEVCDVGQHGTLLPFPTIAGLRTLWLATNDKAEYPTTVTYSQRQLSDIADSLKSYSTQPEVVEDPAQMGRLAIESAIMKFALGNTINK